jgi:hypothetical protein
MHILYKKNWVKQTEEEVGQITQENYLKKLRSEKFVFFGAGSGGKIRTQNV